MTGAFSKPALRVLSVLEAQGDRVGDVLAALKPFFAPILCDRAGQMFDPQKIATAINQAYYWRITHEVVENLVPRFLEWGWLESWFGDNAISAYKIADCWGDEAYNGGDETKIEEVSNQIGDSFAAFLTEHLPQHIGNKGPQELSSAVIEWLVSVDAFTPQKIRERIQGYEVDEFGVMVPKLTSSTGPANTLDGQTSYLCARFVKHLADSGDALFPQLCRLAEVGLLTEVVQDFSKPVDPAARANLLLYVDSPLALDALGMSGKAAKNSILPVLDGLRSVGAKVGVLRDSIEEMRTALDTLLRTPHSERTGPTADALRRREVTQRDIITVLNGPEAALRAIGVEVVERTLSMYPNEHKYFTGSDFEKLKARYSWQNNYAAQEHDAVLVTIVMRRRGDHRSNDFLTCKHLAVSRNGAVIADAEQYCRENGMVARGQVPPVIHSRQLATMAWLRTGLRSNADVPKSTLLAACQRVLTLSPGLLKAAVRKAHELSGKSEEELRLCLVMDRSTMVLMDRTLGDTRILAEQQMEEIIDAMKKAVAAEEIAKAKEALGEEIAAAIKQTEIEAQKRIAEAQKQAQEALHATQNEANAAIADSRAQLDATRADLEKQSLEAAGAESERKLLARRVAQLEAGQKEALQRLVDDTNTIIAAARVALIAAAGLTVIGAVVTSLTIGYASIPLWLLAALLVPTAVVLSVPTVLALVGIEFSIYRITTPLCRRFFYWLATRRGISAPAKSASIEFSRDVVRLLREDS